MAAPVLQAYTMRRGALTLNGAGGAALSQFMLASGSAVVTWSVQSGSMTGLAINAATGVMTPTTNGGWGSSQRVFTIRGTNADGFSEATLTVDIVASAYNVATPAEIESSATGLRQTAVKAALGGRTVIISRGTFDNWNGNGGVTYNAAFECKWRGFNTHTGRLTIRPEFPENTYPSLSRLYFQGCSRIDIEDLGFESWLSASNTNSNNQNVKAIDLIYNSTFGTCSDMTMTGCYGGAPASAGQTQQWMSAIGLLGQTVSPFIPITGITITDCHFQRVKDGWVWQNVNGSVIHGSTITDYCSNASFWSNGLNDNDIEDCIHYRAWANSIDPNDHPDANQFGGGTPRVDYSNNNTRRNMCITGNGDSAPQGPFYDDVAYRLSTVTGYHQNNCNIESNFSDTSTINGIRMDGGSGWNTQRNTIVLGESWIDRPTFEPWILAAAGGALTPVTGIAKNNFAMYRDSVLLSTFPAFDTDNTIPLAVSGPPATWTNALRLSYLTPYYQDPGRTPDWANLTAAQAAQQCREMYAPILNGPLKNADGTYRGSWFPDTTWNDGTVFLETPPSSYTLISSDSATVIGDPVTLTVQMDAAAAGSIVFTPHISGVAGTFSPSTLTLTIGQSSGTIDFTPTSAGAASLSTTNNASLPNPSAVGVTVTSPADAPTTFSQAASRTVSLVGIPLTITYTLDKPATAPVTITPASTVPGTFSAATVVIQTGATVGGVDFTASAYAAGQLTATNDRSLANPSAVNLTATVKRGVALRLRMRSV